MSLRDHPFAVRAHFERSTVLTYALPATTLAPTLPPCLSLDVYDCPSGPLGFVAVALVRTRALRPAVLPAALGRDFFLIGYRIFVRYTDARGKRLRGLYILRSQTDSAAMTRLGSLFTHYAYEHVDIAETLTPDTYAVRSRAGGLHVAFDLERGDLPPDSPFPDWRAARRFAGPLPHTFTYDAARGRVVIVRGLRQNWRPVPTGVRYAEVGLWRAWGYNEARLASAFRVEDVPYAWERGYTETWPR